MIGTGKKKLSTNWGPRSETMSIGRPKLRKTFGNKASSVTIAEERPLMGIKQQAFENQSTATCIQVKESDRGDR